MSTARQAQETDSIPKSKERQSPAENGAVFVPLAGDLLIVIGRDGCFKRLTLTFPPAFGYTEAELIEQPFMRFIHPADRAATNAALDNLARGEPTLGLENRFRCKDASYRWLAWTAVPTPEGLLYAAARDITERGQTEQERAHLLAREQTPWCRTTACLPRSATMCSSR